MTFKSRLFKGAIALSVYAATSISSLYAQEVAQMGTTDLKNEAMALANTQKYLEARPYLIELIKRIEDSTDQALKAELPGLYFFLSYSFLQEYTATPSDKTLQKAIEGFDRIIKDYPTGDFAIPSIKAKAQCYDTLQKPEEASKTREMLLQRPFVDKLTNNEQLDIVRQISEGMYYNRKWKIGEKWFDLLFNRARTPEDKVFAVSGLIQSANESKRFDDIKKYLQYMTIDAPARYDIGLNISFLLAGDELVKKEKISDAILLYSMVLSKDTITKKLKEHLEKNKKYLDAATRANNPNLNVFKSKVSVLEQQIKGLEGVQSYDADLMARAARNYMLTDRYFESFWSYWQLLTLFPDHPSVEDFFYLAIDGAAKVGKSEEMFKLSKEYTEKYPNGNYIIDVRLRIAQYHLKNKEFDTFFALARQFIDEYSDERQANDIVFLMGRTWLGQGKYDDMIKTFGEFNKKYVDSTISEASMYWLGMGYMAKADFPNATKVFVKMIDDYPMGPYSEDGAYRRGVAAFGAGEFQIALDTLEAFLKRHPKSALRGEVEFFLGDIYANVNEVDMAMAHYKVVEQYTKNQNFIDNAYLQGARLLHNVDKYEDEVALMDTYVERFPNAEVTEALYNKAIAKEMLGLPADALAIYHDAIVKYGGNQNNDGVDKMILDYNRMYNSNIGKMKATVEFLGKLMKDKELLELMVAVPAKRYRYFQDNPLIDKRLYEKFKRDNAFGPNLYKDHSVLKNLFDLYSSQIAAYPQGGTEIAFNKILEDAKNSKNKTLQYRIMMGLDSIGKPVRVDRMFDDEDIKKSSVRTLVWIARENAKYGADHARVAYKAARDREEYSYLIDIMFGEAKLEENEKNWDRVLAIYNEIEDSFPSDERASSAALFKADALTKLGKRAEAVKEYEAILRTPKWRGDAHAEALLNLGKVAQHDSKLDDALMYFDRCYLGFASCYKWSGKALLAAAKIYSARNETAKAKEICDEFLSNKLNEASPDYAEIKQYRETL